jgi:hypothetical protein
MLLQQSTRPEYLLLRVTQTGRSQVNLQRHGASLSAAIRSILSATGRYRVSSIPFKDRGQPDLRLTCLRKLRQDARILGRIYHTLVSIPVRLNVIQRHNTPFYNIELSIPSNQNIPENVDKAADITDAGFGDTLASSLTASPPGRSNRHRSHNLHSTLLAMFQSLFSPLQAATVSLVSTVV